MGVSGSACTGFDSDVDHPNLRLPLEHAPSISDEVKEIAHDPIFVCKGCRSRRTLLRLRQNTGVSHAHRSSDFAVVGTRGERDSRGMAKTLELTCVRVGFDIDYAEVDREPHRCRDGLPSRAERR